MINVLWLVVVDNLSQYRCLFVWQCTGTKIFEDYSELSNQKQQTKSKGAVHVSGQKTWHQEKNYEHP